MFISHNHSCQCNLFLMIVTCMYIYVIYCINFIADFSLLVDNTREVIKKAAMSVNSLKETGMFCHFYLETLK